MEENGKMTSYRLSAETRMADVQKVMIQCGNCPKVCDVKPTKTGLPRIPTGWKRHADTVWCKDCWRAKYKLRAIQVPLRLMTPELWDTLSRCWAQAREVANDAVLQLAKADIVRTPEMERLPKMPNVYLYPHSRARRPDMPTNSVVSVGHAVQGKYAKSRLDVLWLGKASLPVYRYGMPYPVHNDGWRVSKQEDGRYVISVNLGDGRQDLILAGGGNFWRQQRAIDQLIAGEAVQGELALIRKKDNAGGHRSGGVSRNGTNGERVRYQVMAKMVMWLPRVDHSGRQRIGSAEVRTTGESLIVAMRPECDEPWVLNVDHVRTWIIGHRRFLDRMSQDMKHEKRWPKSMRRYQLRDLDQRCAKHHNRIKTFLQQTAASLVGWCDRSGLREIRYDDSDRTFLPQFPWVELREQIKLKADDLGIEFVEAVPSSEVIDDQSQEQQ